MKKKLLLISMLLFTYAFITAQTLRPEQFASSVIAFSSEYNTSPNTFSAAKLLGKPEFYPQCGSDGDCWAPLTKNGSREFFVLGFAVAQPVNTIRVYQSWGPGAIDTVYVRNASNGVWAQVYQTTVVNGPACPGTATQLLEITIPTTSYNVDAVRVALASNVHMEWNEIDAVSIASFDQMKYNYNQYASSILGFSSEYNPTPGNYSADKLRGAPDVATPATACGSYSNSWAHLTQDGQREYIEVGYALPSFANRVMIHQTLGAGAIDTVYLKQYGTNTWQKVWDATAATEAYCTASKYLEINFTKTSYLVSGVRVAINSPAVPGWLEIDAVGIRSEIPANAFITKQSGNWSNAATWLGGVVPGSGDEVAIVATHNIELDANGTARSLAILGGNTEANNGSLTINNAANTLTIGDFNTGGGKDSVVVHGTLTITNGSLNIGGRLIQYPYPSDLNHTGGVIRIDGNTGVAGSSVADTDYLLRSLNIYNSGYTFSGGQLIFIDPPFGPSGNSMSWTVAGGKYLGTNSELVFGDGVSTTAGGNADGFRLGVYVAGNISINNPSGTNRNVTNLTGGMTQANSLNITAGTFNTALNLNVIGTTVNNGTLVCTANNLDLRGGLSNNGTVTTSLHLQVDGDVVNNTGASINTTNFYFTKNLTNDGSIGLSNHFSCSRTSLSPSSFAQAISGTGTFNLSTATLRIDNTNAAGVTLNKDLSVSKLALAQGKLYLGNSNITFNTLPVSGGSALSYIVTNGTGRLRFSNLGSSEVLFPIGTATTYNPVKINNGSGHTFSAGVQTGFTTAPPGTEHVNREWDIDDLTGGTVSADVTLQWNTADEDFSFNRNLCAVAHYNGSIWHSLVAASTAANPSPDVYTSIATGVSSFSPFMVSSNSVVLPLKLLSFTAQKENNKVRLSWQTEMETNVSHFEVQRSSDGLNYTNIQNVAASNTMDRQNYSIVDGSPLKGLNFYRLRMVDKNDQFKLSHIVKTNFDKAITMSVSPNPAKAEISIHCDQAITGISIIDRAGKIVLQFAPQASNKYAIQSLRPGIYFVKIFSGNTSEVLRLMKE